MINTRRGFLIYLDAFGKVPAFEKTLHEKDKENLQAS